MGSTGIISQIKTIYEISIIIKYEKKDSQHPQKRSLA